MKPPWSARLAGAHIHMPRTLWFHDIHNIYVMFVGSNAAILQDSDQPTAFCHKPAPLLQASGLPAMANMETCEASVDKYLMEVLGSPGA